MTCIDVGISRNAVAVAGGTAEQVEIGRKFGVFEMLKRIAYSLVCQSQKLLVARVEVLIPRTDSPDYSVSILTVDEISLLVFADDRF